MLDTSGLVTTTIFNTKKEKSGSVKKSNYDAKISDRETKYFITSDYKEFKKEILDAKIKEKWLLNKFDISNLVKMLI